MLPVKVIAVINQKGGVGKTTTVVNLGAALAARGHDVCLVDLDAQSQLTLHLGVEVKPGQKTIYDVMTRGAQLSEAIVDVREHLAVVPSEVDLAAAEMELVGTVGREQVLSDRLAKLDRPCEFVLLDCPPSLGLLTLNALAAADELLIPLQAHFFGLQGLGRLFETVSLVRQRINPTLRVGGVVFCMFERQTRLAGEVVADLTDFLSSARDSDEPWANARIFQNAIRRNVKLAECPSYGRSIFDYEPGSHGAEDYGALADEFLACFAPEQETSQPQVAPEPVEAEHVEAEPVGVVSVEAEPVEAEHVEAEPVVAASPMPVAPVPVAPDLPEIPAEPVTLAVDAEPPARVESDHVAASIMPAVEPESGRAVNVIPPALTGQTVGPVVPDAVPDVRTVPAAGQIPSGQMPQPGDHPPVVPAPPSWSDPTAQRPTDVP